MHDGRFDKLHEVINHYNSNNELKNNLVDPQIKSISLTNNEKVDLIAFLLTLNDREFVFNPKHQFPLDLLNNNK